MVGDAEHSLLITNYASSAVKSAIYIQFQTQTYCLAETDSFCLKRMKFQGARTQAGVIIYLSNFASLLFKSIYLLFVKFTYCLRGN